MRYRSAVYRHAESGLVVNRVRAKLTGGYTIEAFGLVTSSMTRWGDHPIPDFGHP